jgi:tripartite-type tricarboxylate transporter receptor subunit TctC
MAGQINFMFATVPSVISHHRSGKLRGIAVSGARRSAVLPDIPTVAEAGVPGYDIVTWNAIMTPRGVAAPIRERLVKEVKASVEDPTFNARLTSQGAEPESSTPDELAARIRSELARYAKLVRSAGLITN